MGFRDLGLRNVGFGFRVEGVWSVFSCLCAALRVSGAPGTVEVNTLEKREAAASKGASILELVQKYREKASEGGLRGSVVAGFVSGSLSADLPG